MTHELREEVAQSIYTLLAEELFLALLRKPDVARRTKQRAADQLITIWDDAALEIDDFAPLLESAWHARNRINTAYGTLLGATETFRLVTEDCSPEVLEFFGRDGMSADESAAFEEFLFNMTSEELATLRRAMQQQHVSAASPDVGRRGARPPDRGSRAQPRDRSDGALPQLQPPPARGGLPHDVRCTRSPPHGRGISDGVPARSAVAW